METRVLKYIQQQEMIESGDRILLALSGGPDSVCLFHLLLGLRDTLGFTLGVAHINHGLRGLVADEEENFVRELAREHSIPCFIHSEDVAALARHHGLSFEQAARQVRYDFFEAIMELEGFDKTALAHHLNDQAETILHRLIRGSGLNGLAGMRPVRGRYIRPLLAVPRVEILDWLTAKGLPFRLDDSNQSREYTRNRIRLDLIPQLEAFNPMVVQTVGTMSRSLQWDRDYLETAAAEVARIHLREEGTRVILNQSAFSLPPALSSRLVFAALERLLGHRLDLSALQAEEVLALQAGATGRSLDLPNGVTVYNHYGDLEWTRKADQAQAEPGPICLTVDLNHLPASVRFGSYAIELTLETPVGTAHRVDLAELGRHLTIRTRRAQDRIRLPGMSGHKNLRQLFIDRHVHRGLRNRIPVFADESGEIFYIYPGIYGQNHRITKNTDKILYIKVTEIN